MIVAQQKPIEEISALLGDSRRVLILGCGTCVTVCFAGGEKEVSILASQLRMATRIAGQEKEIRELTVQRQCEFEYNEAAADLIAASDLVISLACGIGVQTLNEQFKDRLTVPGLNTSGLSQPTAQGVWEERCQACGDCILAQTGGLCPVARCAKSLMNGPCGGSQRGICEVYADRQTPCVWDQIYKRLQALGQLDKLMDVRPPKNWHPSRDGGQRKIVREDLQL
jgi:ferredoxin